MFIPRIKYGVSYLLKDEEMLRKKECEAKDMPICTTIIVKFHVQ